MLPGQDNKGSCSVHKDECLSNPNPVLKAWKVPGELLVFSLNWKLEEAGSKVSK